LKEVAGHLIRIKPGYMPCCIYELAYFPSMKSQAIFDVMSDSTRRRILALLVADGELCVCELTAALDDIQPKISRHLSVIRDSGLVDVRRRGTWVFYRIADRLPRWQQAMFGALREGAERELALDRSRLQRMSGRPARIAA